MTGLLPTDRPPSGWLVERRAGSATELVDLWPPTENQDDAVVRAGRVRGRPALVLGSTQDGAVVRHERAAAAGIDVVRRPTGGGAVLVGPDAQVWLDVWVPRDHRLWDDDVVRSAHWLGRAWMAALVTLGADSLHVHGGPATRTVWSDLVCFAGLGPGEVQAGTAKVMGLAQRRTRAGARFHTSALLRWDPAPLLDLLDVGHRFDEGDQAAAPLDDVALGLRALVTAWPSDAADADVLDTVENAVIAALP